MSLTMKPLLFYNDFNMIAMATTLNAQLNALKYDLGLRLGFFIFLC